MAYGKYKNLPRRTQSDKVLKDKAFEIASDSKYDGYQIFVDIICISCWHKFLNSFFAFSK